MDPIDKWKERVGFQDKKVNFPYFEYDYPTPFYLYRGESKKYDLPITSRIFRAKMNKKEIELDYYKQQFKSIYRDDIPFDSDINLRFISFLQHHRFRTSLTDVTSDIYTALYFAVSDDIDEEGFIYKIFGYDILSFASDLETADASSIFYDKNFPPKNQPLLNNEFPPFLFYRDTNLYNVNNKRQNGWHIIDTHSYWASDKCFITLNILPEEKKEIKIELENRRYTNEYYFPNINKIAENF